MRPRFTYRCVRPGCTTTKHSDIPLDLPAFCASCRAKDTEDMILLSSERLTIEHEEKKLRDERYRAKKKEKKEEDDARN